MEVKKKELFILSLLSLLLIVFSVDVLPTEVNEAAKPSLNKNLKIIDFSYSDGFDQLAPGDARDIMSSIKVKTSPEREINYSYKLTLTYPSKDNMFNLIKKDLISYSEHSGYDIKGELEVREVKGIETSVSIENQGSIVADKDGHIIIDAEDYSLIVNKDLNKLVEPTVHYEWSVVDRAKDEDCDDAGVDDSNGSKGDKDADNSVEADTDSHSDLVQARVGPGLGTAIFIMVSLGMVIYLLSWINNREKEEDVND